MAYNDLTGKLEEALKAVVDGLALPGLTVNTGIDTDTLVTPYVACTVTGDGNEEITGTGIFRLRGHVEVASSADDTTVIVHRDNVAAIFDAFLDSDIAITLSASVPNFYCYGFYAGALPSEESQRKLVNRLEFETVVCGSDIT